MVIDTGKPKYSDKNLTYSQRKIQQDATTYQNFIIHYLYKA
jgi:hypothetical protein